MERLREAGLQLDNVKLPAHFTPQTLYQNDGLWHYTCQNPYSDSLTDRKIKAHKKKKAETQPEEVTQNEKRPRVPQQKKLLYLLPT